MKYILSHPRLTKSAKPLANRISELVGEQILVKIDADGKFLASNNCIIRYGNSSLSAWITTKYNDSELIKLVGNKLRLSEFLNAENDDEKFNNVILKLGVPDRFPVVVRTELNRGGGIGIDIAENLEQYNLIRNNWWSYWYNFKFELGVHILGGEIKRVFKKVRDDELEEEKYPIRNTQRGYSFRLKDNWKEKYIGLEKFVAQLYKEIPIQFARLDIGYEKETGGYRLIEINSAPDLSQNKNTLNLYAEFLAKKIFNKGE